MSLRFSPTGVAVYGTGTIAVDGAVPAALVGNVVGPAAWETTGVLVYQDGGTGAGPWTFKRLTLPATIANIDASGVTQVAGGGGKWGVWLAGTGVRTDIAIGPFANKRLGDVSPDGELVTIDDQFSLAGLTVYDSSGASIYTDPTIVLQSPQVCLRDSILSYYDATGWHLVNIEEPDETPAWYPRTDGVTALVPITHRGTLYVLEKSTVLTLRQADKSTAWILSSDPNIFPIDGLSLGGSTVLCGTCNVPSETAASLVTFRCTVTKAATIQVATGTVSGGAIVYGSATAVAVSPFTVGALEGDTLTPTLDLPFKHPIAENIPKHGLMLTDPWRSAFQTLDDQVVAASNVLQKLPTPDLSSVDAFKEVASTGQPPLKAQPGLTTLNLESANGSVIFAFNPATNTVDLSSAGAWIPLVDGSEPPNFITDGAGHLILVAYP